MQSDSDTSIESRQGEKSKIEAILSTFDDVKMEKLPKLMKGSQGKRLQEGTRKYKANNHFQSHRGSNAEPTSKPLED